MFGASHRKPWRNKGKDIKSLKSPLDNQPGAKVAVDQLISRQPGLVPQYSGRMTASRIWAATIFIDYFTDYTFAYLMRSTSQEETLNAKSAFERKMKEFNVIVNSYHADNGRFAEKEFREEIIKCNQSISFCAVGAHHQNGLVENRIKDCTLGTRTILLHAKRFWPEAITTMLWPFALLAFIERRNSLHLDANNQTPNQKISKQTKIIELSKFHTWGCLVFVLESKVQTDSKDLPK